MNRRLQHIPILKTIGQFYHTFQIGTAPNDSFTIMRMEDQAKGKLLYMPLFRGNFFRLVFCKTPGLRFLLPDQTVETSRNSLYFAHPGKIESWQRVEVIYGFLCCFTPEFAGIDLLRSSFEKEFPFLTAESDSLISLTKKEANTLSQIAEAMLKEMNASHPDKFDMLKHLLHVYLIQIRRMYYKKVSTKSALQLNHAAIVGRFKKTVNDYFMQLASGSANERPSVSTISSLMNLNASYLNAIIKQHSGFTASSFIHEKTILEAKSYLMHTNLQVAEISYRLQFRDIPYFTRFFKKMTGITPGTFRTEALKKFSSPLPEA
ncbi:MAG: AraC family transcriptional regulator [Mucilaginibacter sp.]|nr:AraC family transcriptional regulator [Mucilaginibacter sp.]